MRVLIEDLGRRLGEPEARREIRHDAHAPLIDLARQRLAVRLIDQREHGRGMGMIDELMGHEGVQQRLDRWVGRARLKQVQTLHVDHGFVAERAQRAKAPQRLELHRRHALRFDIGHVPARALDRDDLVLLAEIVARPRLHRSVAAAMQHEQRIAAQEARGIDAERDVLADALGAIGLDRFRRFIVIPLAFHGGCSGKFPRLRQATACLVSLRRRLVLRDGPSALLWTRLELSSALRISPHGSAPPVRSQILMVRSARGRVSNHVAPVLNARRGRVAATRSVRGVPIPKASAWDD